MYQCTKRGFLGYYQYTRVANGMRGLKSSFLECFCIAPFKKIHSCLFDYSPSFFFLRTKYTCRNKKVVVSVLYDRVLCKILKISQILELDSQNQKSGALLGTFKTM